MRSWIRWISDVVLMRQRQRIDQAIQIRLDRLERNIIAMDRKLQSVSANTDKVVCQMAEQITEYRAEIDRLRRREIYQTEPSRN